MLALLGLAGCDKKAATGPRLVYTGPLMETTNVLTLVSDSAKLKFQLTAPLEQQFENGDILYPKGAVVTFYSADGLKHVINTLTAKYAKFEKAKNLYTMRGAVEVVNVPQEQRMNTEELFYDKNKALIYTDSAMFVKVTTPTEYLTGYGLTANQNFSRYRILRPEGVFAAPAVAPAPAATAPSQATPAPK
ncbi:LPS export ABC transporter periplasmic protein LptC [Hymenobacter sp. BT770]|uniref:LPS export ABC transporter periplasmic protein LptC n=1 Tax=Hymenobacter sp. BT770 TaxID=2886942 RepID=UPI001D0F91A6|nr:LPS export ABC transporter periplasmic protein LptC [Hymenobacter sp. BT770]MCC3153423.1 LPS export ABC transporter periplasmic protein LptC [Hymenobacter sp. BT770]MDO3415495.1 LPS export ABC transporter periplasmic protein LptC [Hymenobacter sp. BT770]